MKTSDAAEVRAMYDDTADGYAQMMDAEIELPLYEDTLRRLAEGLASLSGPLVDTSCGSGHMLQRYHQRFDAGRALVGIDLAPAMVALSRERLGAAAQIHEGDMCQLDGIEADSAAGVLSFFAVHHLDPEQMGQALAEWKRVLQPGGRLILAAWEGEGPIDYGGFSDIVALRYTAAQLEDAARAAGFDVVRCVTEAVEGFPMDAVYIDGIA